MLFRHKSVRPGQNELIEDMKRVVDSGIMGFFEAPTGLGKTDASLAATLEFALNNKKKIFFVTPKTSQHKIVVDAIKGINKTHETKLRVLDLVAKPHLCTDPFLYGMGSEFYDLCDKKIEKKGCIGYLNTIGYNKEQKLNALKNIDKFSYSELVYTHDELRDECLNEPILCPYELSMRLVKDVNVIIVDVNHIFVPSIRQKLFAKMQIESEDCIFIFDEAHNLPNRIRAILSTTINKKIIELAIKELQRVDEKKLNPGIKEFMDEFQELYLKFETGFLDFISFDELFSRYNFDSIMSSLAKAAEFTIENYETKSHLSKVFEFFMRWYEGRDSKARYLDAKKSINIKALDPSILSKDIINEAHSCLFMSATLSPSEMYESLLGVNKEVFRKRYISPFSKENKLVMYSQNVTTKYDERAENMDKITNIISEVVNSVSGNIAVFFPSYKLMDEIYTSMQDRTQKKIFIQKQNTTHLQNKRIIEQFKKSKSGFGGILFAVIGGSFAEGVDYPGDDLIGIIVVGLPFPEPDYEIKALIEYYNKLYNSGWDYAYVFPTISKIVQAAGRAIRTETDRAFILLLDKRYIWSKYKNLFPVDYEFKYYDIENLHKFMKNK